MNHTHLLLLTPSLCARRHTVFTLVEQKPLSLSLYPLQLRREDRQTKFKTKFPGFFLFVYDGSKTLKSTQWPGK